MSPSGYRKLVFGCAIAGLSIWYGVSQLLPGTGPAQAEAATDESVAIDEILAELSAATPTISEDLPREQQMLVAEPWPADPFFPLPSVPPVSSLETAQKDGGTTHETEQPGFVLNAIISGPEPLAMINGLVVAIGDRLADGSVITAIDSYSVTLRRPQGPWTLRLSE